MSYTGRSSGNKPFDVYDKSEVDAKDALKLDSSVYTAADILTKLETVDGLGSGLDTDLVRGWDGALVWYSPTLLNSWVNYDTTTWAACQYTKNPMTNEVTIRGLIKGGSNTADTTIFTLPVGFRPLLNELHIQEVNGGYVRAQLLTNGTVDCYASEAHDGNANIFMALNIKFIAGQ